jgi:hypothetical protein
MRIFVIPIYTKNKRPANRNLCKKIWLEPLYLLQKKINMSKATEPFIEYITTNTDGNYVFFPTSGSEFTLVPGEETTNVINDLISKETIKPESVTKLQELNII